MEPEKEYTETKELVDRMEYAIRKYRKAANVGNFNWNDQVAFYLDPVHLRQLELHLLSFVGVVPDFQNEPRFMGIRVISGEWKYGLTPNVITLEGGTTFDKSGWDYIRNRP